MIAVALGLLSLVVMIATGVAASSTGGDHLTFLGVGVETTTAQVFMTGAIFGWVFVIALWLLRVGIHRSGERCAQLAARRSRRPRTGAWLGFGEPDADHDGWDGWDEWGAPTHAVRLRPAPIDPDGGSVGRGSGRTDIRGARGGGLRVSGVRVSGVEVGLAGNGGGLAGEGDVGGAQGHGVRRASARVGPDGGLASGVRLAPGDAEGARGGGVGGRTGAACHGRGAPEGGDGSGHPADRAGAGAVEEPGSLGGARAAGPVAGGLARVGVGGGAEGGQVGGGAGAVAGEDCGAEGERRSGDGCQ